MDAVRVQQLNHVALSVGNLEASKRFYGDVLGLPEIARPAFAFPGAWFALGPEQQLHLIADGAPIGAGSSRGDHFALAVPDAAAASGALQSRGVAHRGPGRRPDGAWQIFLADPDGHVVELCQLPE